RGLPRPGRRARIPRSMRERRLQYIQWLLHIPVARPHGEVTEPVPAGAGVIKLQMQLGRGLEGRRAGGGHHPGLVLQFEDGSRDHDVGEFDEAFVDFAISRAGVVAQRIELERATGWHVQHLQRAQQSSLARLVGADDYRFVGLYVEPPTVVDGPIVLYP